MRNKNLLIAGATGSGKSTLTRELVRLSARVIVHDTEDEYQDGFIAYDVDEAARYFLEMRHRDFQLVCRLPSEEMYAVFELAYHTQRVEPWGPLVAVMEEATAHSTPWDMNETVHEMYVKGRHARISNVTIVQLDTDINRITKHSTAAVVSFRQNYLSESWKRFFSWDDIQALHMLDGEYGVGAGKYLLPVQGRHFLTAHNIPDDLYTWWFDNHAWVAKTPAE